MATRKPRITMGTDGYKAKLEKAKAALKVLEEEAYASELEEFTNAWMATYLNMFSKVFFIHEVIYKV
jgi:cob(I)alamin adenosyltransferase